MQLSRSYRPAWMTACWSSSLRKSATWQILRLTSRCAAKVDQGSASLACISPGTEALAAVAPPWAAICHAVQLAVHFCLACLYFTAACTALKAAPPLKAC